jgi:hypothetical protein
MWLALFSLYPFLAVSIGFLTAGILVLSTGINVVLTTLCVALYMMIPIGSFDHWFSSVIQLVRTIVPDSFARLESNFDKTFEFYEKTRPERALYLWHPHGMLSLTPIIHTIRRKLGKIACVQFFHKVPIVRDMYHFVGSVPSEYSAMKNTLEKESLSVIPGGTREMMVSTSKTMRLILKDRTGVFKLALQTGTPIVPVLTYGEEELFPQLDMPILRSINQWFYSNWKFAIPFMSITSIANWLHLADSPLPPIRSYAGEPIEVAKILEPSMEQIQELRKTYCDNLERLFRETAPKRLKLEVE